MENTIAVIIWVVFGTGIGNLIGRSKGREEYGIGMGLLFGPLGWIFVAVMSPTEEYTCPHCGGIIVPGYPHCKNCGVNVKMKYYTCTKCDASILFQQNPCPNCKEEISWDNIQPPVMVNG